MPRAPLARAADLYALSYSRLGPGQRALIEEKLRQGRVLDVVVEQTCGVFEKEIAGVVARSSGIGVDAPACLELSEIRRRLTTLGRRRAG